eukprot:4182972-Pleurochrysis_carterae.AAC.3
MACYFVFSQITILSADKQDVALCMLHEFFAMLDFLVYAIAAAMVFSVVLVICAPFYSSKTKVHVNCLHAIKHCRWTSGGTLFHVLQYTHTQRQHRV